MKRILSIDAVRAAPGREAVLASQEIPANAPVPPRILELSDRAERLYAGLAEPRGIYEEIGVEPFGEIFRGDGRNAQPNPLESIYPGAERLALFSVTLGPALSEKIARLFGANEPALAYMLDAIASRQADRAAELLGRGYLESLREEGKVAPGAALLPYSPGYCGWHITGQRALFRGLEPERIGITLNQSCLMQPLKSVSGVFVVGPPELHDFDNEFDFCDDCATKDCRARIASLRGAGGVS